MESGRRFSVLVCSILILALPIIAQGPVFINPNSPVAVTATSDANQGNYVTQTVYGFLDFTTTIGNTVMVFSPQSAAAAVAESPKIANNEITSNNVIETKPLAPKKDDIQPTKTITSNLNKPSSEDKLLSVVNAQSEKPASVVSTVKSAPSSKVDVIVNKASAVVEKQPIVMSKVEVVVEGSPSSKPKPNIITKVEVISGPTELAKQEAIIASRVEVVSNEPTNVVSSVVQVKSDEEPALIIGNNIGEPEYDFLSRQPSEVVEETYKVVNLKPSSKFILRHRPSTEAKKNPPTKKPGGAHPTGLVTKLGGTVVKDGITTVIETSVIGTYISGKYAQVLQSSSKRINPTQSQRILKTAAPSIDAAHNTIKSTRKAAGGFKRFKNRHKEADAATEDNNDQEVAAPATTHPNYKKSQKNRAQSTTRGSKHHTTSSTHSSKKHGRKRGRTTTTPKPYVNSEETTASSKRYSSGRRHKQGRASTTPSQQSESNGGFSRRAFKPKVQASNVEQTPATTTSSLYKFKLNRSPGRWQYKTTPKPRVTIRKQNIDEPKDENSGTTASVPQQEPVALAVNEVVTPQARSDDIDSLEGSESIASVVDDTSTSDNKLEPPAFPVETIKVEISTPPDFGDIYYEIATIKSPYTFQVGSVKNTRYITVTSTFEKSLEPSIESTSIKPTEPLTENILATNSNYKDNNNILDSSIATLPPLFLASDMETPPLETVTETFSTTQTMLKTHILPVIRHGNETSSSTLVQTFVITRLVTATKTLPPMEAYQFIPSKTLNEFNSHLDEAGSELHLELEFGDENDEDGGQIRKISLPSDLDLANIGSNLDLSDDDKVKLMEAHLRSKKIPTPKQPSPPHQQQLLNPEQLQQLALYRLLNPQAAQGQVITTSKPVVKVETLFETFILPVTQGHNTIQSTISKIKGTITKTDYEYGTSTIAPVLSIPQLPQLPPQIPQLPQLTPQLPQLNPYLPQPQLVVTSSPVVQSTSITQTNSKVLKLTFGAKTAHTTVYSTTVIPTVLTTYITQSVPVAPTAAYPGYFPAPFPPYPYVG